MKQELLNMTIADLLSVLVGAETKELKPVRAVRKSGDRLISPMSNWKLFLNAVKASGVEMYDTREEEGIVVIQRNDADCSKVAFTYAIDGLVYNGIWGTGYEYPMVFAPRLSVDKLKEIREEVDKNLPKEVNKLNKMKEEGWNGNPENFYYNELANGNYIARFYREGEINPSYIGYIYEKDCCFIIHEDGSIATNHIKFFFTKTWGKPHEKREDILALKERAFGNYDGSRKTDVSYKVETILDDTSVINTEVKNNCKRPKKVQQVVEEDIQIDEPIVEPHIEEAVEEIETIAVEKETILDEPDIIKTGGFNMDINKEKDDMVCSWGDELDDDDDFDFDDDDDF